TVHELKPGFAVSRLRGMIDHPPEFLNRLFLQLRYGYEPARPEKFQDGERADGPVRLYNVGIEIGETQWRRLKRFLQDSGEHQLVDISPLEMIIRRTVVGVYYACRTEKTEFVAVANEAEAEVEVFRILTPEMVFFHYLLRHQASDVR